MTTRITEAEARAYLGGIARSTLHKHYAGCKVTITPGRTGRVAWDRDKLDKRQAEIARQSTRAKRSA